MTPIEIQIGDEIRWADRPDLSVASSLAWQEKHHVWVSVDHRGPDLFGGPDDMRLTEFGGPEVFRPGIIILRRGEQVYPSQP